MNYWKQIWTVTEWEYARCFKPKGELILLGFAFLIPLFILLVISYYQEGSDDKPNIYLIGNQDIVLHENLSYQFKVNAADILFIIFFQ